MNHYGVYLILLLTGVCFIAVSCFVKKEMVKNIILSFLSLGAIVCIGTVTGRAYCALERFNYNAWYSMNTYGLIEVTIEKLEKGQQELVITELKKLQSKFYPTYEVKGNYDELVEEAVKNLNADPIQSNLKTE